MTENEAIEYIEELKGFNRKGEMITPQNKGLGFDTFYQCAFNHAVKVFEEIQQYRAIGTVEECREAMERQIPKKPNVWGDGYDDEGNMIYDTYDCPECGKSYEVDYDDHKFCPECGQAMDWSDIE